MFYLAEPNRVVPLSSLLGALMNLLGDKVGW
jgi:hypothetical protein